MTEMELKILQLRSMAAIREQHGGRAAILDALDLSGHADELTEHGLSRKAWRKYIEGARR